MYCVRMYYEHLHYFTQHGIRCLVFLLYQKKPTITVNVRTNLLKIIHGGTSKKKLKIFSSWLRFLSFNRANTLPKVSFKNA